MGKIFVIFILLFSSFNLFAEGNLASQPTKLELEIKGDLSMSAYSFELETGKFYKRVIESDGIEEMMLQAPDIFRNVWVSQIVIDEREIHGVNSLYGIEFDDEGDVAIFLVPIRPGKFEYYVKGYKDRGMVGTFNVK